MARDMAPLIAAAVPDNDAACFVGGLSVGGWLAVETALRLAPLGKRAAAVFALDGPEPSQFDLDCSYAPAEAAAELLLGRNRRFPEGWAAMSEDQRVDAFLALLPSLGIHFLGYDAAKGDVENREIVSRELTAGAAAFIDTLRTPGVYDKATSKLDADLVLFRASERRAVKMLKDGDAAPHGYAWASAGVPNVTVVDCASHHMNVLLCRGAIRRKVLEFVLGCV
jgi:pimeloyl-ACP methyl ester carboxylesterase